MGIMKHTFGWGQKANKNWEGNRKENMKLSNRIFGTLAYSFLAALVPCLFLGISQIVCLAIEKLGDAVIWFLHLSYFIQITVFIVVGLCFQQSYPLFNSKNDVGKP
jgi:hypothetical protein